METIPSTQFHTGGDNTEHNLPCSRKLHNSTLADHITILHSWRQYKAHSSTLVETIQSTTFRARRKLHKAHNSALVDHTTIPLVETIQSTQFHTGRDNTEHNIPRSRKLHKAIPCSWRQYKAHSSTLAETIQSTTFCARGNYIKHTIPCSRIALQFHARGDNTKHTVPHWWRQYKAQHSALAENYIKHTIPCLRITLQFHACGDNTKHTVPHWWRQYRA